MGDHCAKYNRLSDTIKIPLWAVIFVCLARVWFTCLSAPPSLFLHWPGVISMRINVAINHSVPALPDVIQGLLKTSAHCDVYGRREIWAWQPGPKILVQAPSGTFIQSVSSYCPGLSQTQSRLPPPEGDQSKPSLIPDWGLSQEVSQNANPTGTFKNVYHDVPDSLKFKMLSLKISLTGVTMFQYFKCI